MSTDEDFSLIMEKVQPPEETLEGIMALITDYKTKYDQLVQEQTDLAKIITDHQGMTQAFKQRLIKLSKSLENDQISHNEQIKKEMKRLNLLKLEEIELMEKIQKVEAAQEEEKIIHDHLIQETNVFSAVPEKKVVFLGETKTEDAQMFDMKSRIVYPMDGGTALITFEEEVVAQKILTKKKHQVHLVDGCYVTVEAQPVQLMLPSLVEIYSEVCPQRMLISNLPKIDPEGLLNMLGIYFHRGKNGGGEVESCEFLPDSGTVVLTFVDKKLAKGLTDKEYHKVELQRKEHRVRVTPFLNGKVTNFETRMMACPRTVLLTGIPPVMEQETLNEMLEIYFQKNSNGGGEIVAFFYNPLGQQTSALFESISLNAEVK